MSNVLGVAGSILSAFISLPQAVRARRVGVEGVSGATFQIAVLDTFFWLVYDAREHYWVAIPGIICIILCGLSILLSIFQANRRASEVAPILAGGLLVLGVLFMTASNELIGWIAAAGAGILGAPQLRDVFISKKVDGVSIPTWTIYAASSFCWFFFGIVQQDARVWAANAGSFTISVAIALETKRRRIKKAAITD